jgi:UTP:GlnB (protein PII) uridylyltransferase
MVSEGDLIGRDDAAREARRDWWLTLLAEGEALSPEFLGNLRTPEKRARDVMAAPAVTVSEDIDLREVARLLTEYRIKRVPVVRAGEGRVVGIVSRADLVRAMASEHRQSAETAAAAAPRHNMLAELAAKLDQHFARRSDAEEIMSESHAAMKPVPVETLSAADIKRRMAEREVQKAAEELSRMREQEEKQKAVMAEFHAPPDQSPEQLMQRVMQLVDQAAENGQTEVQVYRFPSELCTDRGRRINNSGSTGSRPWRVAPSSASSSGATT